jgi:hypothetical protein
MSIAHDAQGTMDLFVQFSKCLGALPFVEEEGFQQLRGRIIAAMNKILDEQKMPQVNTPPVTESEPAEKAFSFAGGCSDPTASKSKQPATDLLYLLLNLNLLPDDIAYCLSASPWMQGPTVAIGTTLGQVFKIMVEKQDAEIHVADLVVDGAARRCCGHDCQYVTTNYGTSMKCALNAADPQDLTAIPRDSQDFVMDCTALCAMARGVTGKAKVTLVDKPAVFTHAHSMWIRKLQDESCKPSAE